MNNSVRKITDGAMMVALIGLFLFINRAAGRAFGFVCRVAGTAADGDVRGEIRMEKRAGSVCFRYFSFIYYRRTANLVLCHYGLRLRRSVRPGREKRME